MFIDEAKVYVKAGNGGNGCVSFHREKYLPKGGPDGGDGGNGGSIILTVDEGLRALMDFQYHRHFKAERGQHGQGNNKHGKNGADLFLAVPPGTVVYDENQNVLGDLINRGEQLLVARGGRGGRGNSRFANQWRKAPAFAEKGEPGEAKFLFLELKLLADVGLIGYPNVGKSTLISRISSAKPKIADYPFTTLQPNLGVVRLPDDRTFVVADVPGLIEGAHQGKGLGDKFLRHLERTAILLHLIDLSAPEQSDPIEDFWKIQRELESYSSEMALRPQVVVGTKIDLPEARGILPEVQNYFQRKNIIFFAISSITGEGVEDLLYKTADLLEKRRAAQRPKVGEGKARRLYRYRPEEAIKVSRLGKRFWQLSGKKVERIVQMTDFKNEEAIDYLKERLAKLNLDKQLLEAGAQKGDRVKIATAIFDFEPGQLLKARKK